MLKYYLALIIVVGHLANSFSQSGISCYDPIDANVVENRIFNGEQNADQWFTYRASKTGKLVVSSCNLTDEDTYVKVYQGGLCIPLILKVENDNHCLSQSKVSFIGTEGYDYLIVWTNKSSSKSFDWSVMESEWLRGEVCNNPIIAEEGNNNECDHSEATNQWFSFTPTENGTVTVSTCDLTIENTSVRIFDSCSGIQLSGNDDNCSEQSEVSFNVNKNQSYLIEWENVHTSGIYNWSLAFVGTPTLISNVTRLQVMIKQQSNALEVVLPQKVSSEVKIFNVSGTLVKTSFCTAKEFVLNCTDLSRGIYIVQITTNTGVYTQRVLID